MILSSTKIIQRLEDKTKNIRYSEYDEDKKKYIIECKSGGIDLKVTFYKNLLNKDSYIDYMTKNIIAYFGNVLFRKK